MTNDEYVEIASIIRSNNEAVSNGDESDEVFDMLETLSGELADYFESNDPNFPRGLFLVACGVPADGKRRPKEPTVGFVGDAHSGGVIINEQDVGLNGIPTDNAVEIVHKIQAALGIKQR